MCDMLEIQGVVSSVNEKLLIFEVDDTTVHVAYMFAHDPAQYLPAKGAEVRVGSRIFHSAGDKVVSMVLTPTASHLSEDFSFLPSETSLATFIRDLSLSPDDLLDFSVNYENLKNYLVSPHLQIDELLIHVVTTLKLMRFKLQFVSRCKFVHDSMEQYKSFSYWTLCHNSNSFEPKPEYLIGFLFVRNGKLYLTDFKLEILCLMVNNDLNLDVSEYCNTYVLIKEYIFINEIYNGKDVSISKYLIVKINSVTKLDIYKEKISLFPNPNALTQYKRTPCYIASKSLPTITANGVCYLLAVLLQNERIFLKLDSQYIDLYPHLVPGQSYELFYKNAPYKTYTRELYILDPKVRQLKLTPDSHFIPTSCERAAPKILTTSEALDKLNSTDLISFEGVISVKKFVEPLKSRTESVGNDLNYGTPGFKTHLLDFQLSDHRSLTLYLNNWENMATPCGLIPKMRVIVYNVKPQSRSYFKATVMTSIKCVSYDPYFNYETANLFDKDLSKPFYFGASSLLPKGVIIYGRITSFFVLGLKIGVERGSNQVTLNPSITLIVVDNFGESKVIAKSDGGLQLLKILLGMQEVAFKKWCQGFGALGDFNYWKGMDTFGEAQDTPRGMLLRLIESFGTRSVQLNLMCRKMDQEPNGKGVYYFLDGSF